MCPTLPPGDAGQPHRCPSRFFVVVDAIIILDAAGGRGGLIGDSPDSFPFCGTRECRAAEGWAAHGWHPIKPLDTRADANIDFVTSSGSLRHARVLPSLRACGHRRRSKDSRLPCPRASAIMETEDVSCPASRHSRRDGPNDLAPTPSAPGSLGIDRWVGPACRPRPAVLLIDGTR